jgi:hypothetical protein
VDLQALRQALVGACTEQGLALYPDVPNSPELPCLYAGMPTDMREFSSAGQCTVDIALTLCVSRADEDVAQKSLSGFISTMQIPNAIMNATPFQWSGIAFINIDNIRAASFGETTQVLAADFNFQLRTK